MCRRDNANFVKIYLGFASDSDSFTLLSPVRTLKSFPISMKPRLHIHFFFLLLFSFIYIVSTLRRYHTCPKSLRPRVDWGNYCHFEMSLILQFSRVRNVVVSAEVLRAKETWGEIKRKKWNKKNAKQLVIALVSMSHSRSPLRPVCVDLFAHMQKKSGEVVSCVLHWSAMSYVCRYPTQYVTKVLGSLVYLSLKTRCDSRHHLQTSAAAAAARREFSPLKLIQLAKQRREKKKVNFMPQLFTAHRRRRRQLANWHVKFAENSPNAYMASELK